MVFFKHLYGLPLLLVPSVNLYKTTALEPGCLAFEGRRQLIVFFGAQLLLVGNRSWEHQ